MDFTLTPEQELIRGTAREFLEREVVPHARDWDRSETMDRGIVGKLAEIGFLGASLPAEHGGMGLDTISYCLVMEELGRADSSVRGIVSVQNGLVGKTVAKWATDEQRSEWLPRLASGEALGCYALTEPGSGSDPASLTTKAERDGDDWLLTGSKIFITLGTWAELALVFARSGEGGARGITCFLVPTGSEGFEARPIKGKLGLRAQDTGRALPRAACACRTRRGSAPKARASRSRCPRSTTVASRSRPAAWGSPRAASTPRSATRRNGRSSASRSPASSSCRSCSPTSRSRPTPRGC